MNSTEFAAPVDRTDALIAALALIGCAPQPSFTRDRQIIWQAACPCRELIDGHGLTIRTDPDRQPHVNCECGASAERLLATIEHQWRSADEALAPFVWPGS